MEKNRAGSQREKADDGTVDGGTEQWCDALVVLVAATKLQCQLPALVSAAAEEKRRKRKGFVREVLVMTPQLLLDALRKAFLKMESICLMIIDECHQAIGNHPYAKVMK
ncbi:hypothetical protein HN873_014948, partial [Arachis hypogaea]